MDSRGPRKNTPGRVVNRLLGLAMLACATVSQGEAPAPILSPAQIAQSAIPSVVQIKTPTGLGTGFVAAKGGKIVTNLHVTGGESHATIQTSDGAEYKDVEVIAIDPARDLAVLRIAARDLKPLPLGDSSLAKPGEHVVAIGNPLGLGDTVSDGLLSGLRKLPRLDLLQISAPISPGSSGGPVFNDRGEVIGVSALLLTGGQNLNFAIPINAVKAMLAGETGKPLASYATPGPRRQVPNLPVSDLNACPGPQLRTVVSTLSRAIDVGAPLYNQGNFEACYRIYEGAALELQHSVSFCPGPKRALADGLSHADRVTEWSDKAWAMRDSFDGVLALALKAGRPNGGAVQRHIPDVPPSALAGCPAADAAGIATEISGAVDSGAPLYNQGNVEACYRIYEGAIGAIDRKYDHCPAARQVLKEGVRQANELTGWKAKAWALRDAFDGLMNAIARSQAGGK